MSRVNVIGCGLAGAEAAYQLAKRGIEVVVYEMKPTKFSPAHKSPNFAEIVCSNSFKSEDKSTASGCLKDEMRVLDSLILQCAEQVRVQAGTALAVDRDRFSELVTQKLSSMSGITIKREEVKKIDLSVPTIIATGPLTSDDLAKELSGLLGSEYLHFYDASAPIVDGDTIDYEKTFSAGRYGKGDGDYINCPLNEETYYRFVEELKGAERVELHNFEKREIFEGCMPIEVMASRGKDTLRFGTLRPVGLRDKDGKRPFAVVQLRRESTKNNLFNLVGFQTNLKFNEQKRVFSMIPALENADFVKFGVMHRNSYICAPKHLNRDFGVKGFDNLYIAGQLSGVEGYMESTASGLVAGIYIAHKIYNKPLDYISNSTIIGAIINYITSSSEDNFQPMNANFGILEELDTNIKDKSLKKQALYERAMKEIKKFKESLKC